MMPSDDKKPTIEELQKVLDDPAPLRVVGLPDGSITAMTIDELKAERDRLAERCKALSELLGKCDAARSEAVLEREALTDRLATAEARVKELDDRQFNHNVLFCEICGHDVNDPMMSVIDPVSLVKTYTDALTQRLAGMEQELTNCIAELKLWKSEGCDCLGEGGHVCGLPRLQRSIEKAQEALEGM